MKWANSGYQPAYDNLTVPPSGSMPITRKEIKSTLASQLRRLDGLSDVMLKLTTLKSIVSEQQAITTAMCEIATTLNGIIESHPDLEDK